MGQAAERVCTDSLSHGDVVLQAREDSNIVSSENAVYHLTTGYVGIAAVGEGGVDELSCVGDVGRVDGAVQDVVSTVDHE